MRVNWTDDRLDDLKAHVDQRFGQVDQRFDRIDADIREMRTEMNARFDSLQRALLLGSIGMISAFGAALIGAVAT